VAYRTFHVGRYVFIRWTRPEVADIDTLIGDVEQIRRGEKERLIMFSIIPAHADPPDAAFRKKLLSRWATLLPEGETVHAVLEGSGIGASLNRAVLTTIRLLVRGRGIGRIHSSLEVALREERVPSTITMEQLRKALS
jgi:hypothetical protein